MFGKMNIDGCEAAIIQMVVQVIGVALDEGVLIHHLKGKQRKYSSTLSGTGVTNSYRDIDLRGEVSVQTEKSPTSTLKIRVQGTIWKSSLDTEGRWTVPPGENMIITLGEEEVLRGYWTPQSLTPRVSTGK